LYGVGRDQYDGIEEYVCRLYSVLDFTAGVNKARSDLFSKGNKELEKFPPTFNVLKLHAARANYQAKIWLQPNLPVMEILLEDGRYR